MACFANCALASEKGSVSARLPGDAIPSAYQLFIEPRLDDGKFEGSESIDLQIVRPTQTIVLNVAEMSVTKATCIFDGSSRPVELKIHLLPKLEQVALQLPYQVEPKHGVLSLQFSGKLSNKSKGFFRSHFTDKNGQKRWLAATQMEPIDARRMFPCFDEPAYKATFSISTKIDCGDTAISNGSIVEESFEPKTHQKLVKFEQTPRMSTYLVALAIGPFVPTEPVFANGIPIRIWCTKGKEKLTGFSKIFAPQVLEYYTKYFGVPYCAKKLDLIAIPDFANGAMENLGACTFREDLLLVDEKTASLGAKQQVALNVAHEMAHLWFGDLVTMKWWDDLWLNEAFAEWMSTKAVDKLEPNWHYWNQFALEREESMLSDSLRASRPIHADVTEPNQIGQMFDEITYQKGASVLRMLEQTLSENTFRNGISAYINAHQFKNATPEDLWTALSEKSGKNVSDMMHGWVYQEGFPVVTVDTSPSKLEINQKRFTFKRGRAGGEEDRLWQIPLEVRSLSDNQSLQHEALITTKTESISRDSDSPLMVNAGGEGYYRVRYSPSALATITEHLKEMTPLERASALSDQFYLAVAGQVPVKQYLDFSESFKDESDPMVTSVLCSELSELNLLTDDNAKASFAEFVRGRLSNAKRSFGWQTLESDTDLIKEERAEVLLTLGTIGQDKETIEKARELAKKCFDDPETKAVAPDLFAPMLKIVAYNGDLSDYEKIESLWHSAKSPEREHSALMSLSMFRDSDLIKKTLKMTLTNKIEKQDAPEVFAAVMATRDGRGPAWEFFRKHIIHIAWRFPDHLMCDVVMAMNSLATERELKEVRAFFKKHPVPSQSRGIDKIIEAIEIRVAFRQHSILANSFTPLIHNQLYENRTN
jgi:puromycin-sensitive aminopeptidase